MQTPVPGQQLVADVSEGCRLADGVEGEGVEVPVVDVLEKRPKEMIWCPDFVSRRTCTERANIIKL